MPVPSPRNKILPARGNFADLSANLASLMEGEICYALDQDQYYQKEGGALVSVGASKTQGILADSAVQRAGDNMTGDLTLGTDKITLNAQDGSASFDSYLLLGDAGSSTEWATNFNNGVVQTYRASGDATNQPIFLGGRKDGATSVANVEINADGSADFAGGDFQIFSGAEIKATVDSVDRNAGAFNLAAGSGSNINRFSVRKDGSVYIGTGWGTDAEIAETKLYNDGSATFAGSVTSGNTTLNVASFDLNISNGTDNVAQYSAGNGLYIGNTGSNNLILNSSIQLGENGSARFAGAVETGTFTATRGDGARTPVLQTSGSGNVVFGDASQIVFANDGSASFAGGDFTISSNGETIVYGQIASGYDAVAGATRDYGHVCVSKQNSTGNYATGYFRNMDVSGRAIYVADSTTGDSPTFEVSATGTAISHNLGGPHFIARGGTGGAYSLYQNNATGTAASDGLLVGYLATGGYLWNYEPTPLLFGMDSLERGRINSQGYFQLSNVGGTGSTRYGDDKTYHTVHTSAEGGAICLFENTSNNPYGIYVQMAGAAPNNDSNYFISCEDSGSQKFYVFSSGNVRNATNSYGAISDVNLKQDIVDSSSQWDDIKNIRVRNYRLKSDVEACGDDATTMLGVVAQEVEPISPGLVSINEDTGEKSVAYSVLYMKSVKALQEAMERIEALEARIAQLEA